MMIDSKNENLFFQRLSELAKRCTTRYCPEFTHFLDGRSLYQACEYLRTRWSDDVRVVSYGGFMDAERRIVGIFPKDIYPYENVCDEELYEFFDIGAVEIIGSGFSTFNHRDVMGSVLGLGIKRETMGDIYVAEDNMHAYICLNNVACRYLCDSLESVSRDRVKVKEIKPRLLPVPERRYSVISGTVASERLDCVVALATGLSREKSKQLISSGFVNVNHFEETKCDIQLLENDILSIRGYGRFKLAELGSLTRKGRNRVTVHKMI